VGFCGFGGGFSFREIFGELSPGPVDPLFPLPSGFEGFRGTRKQRDLGVRVELPAIPFPLPPFIRQCETDYPGQRVFPYGTRIAPFFLPSRDSSKNVFEVDCRCFEPPVRRLLQASLFLSRGGPFPFLFGRSSHRRSSRKRKISGAASLPYVPCGPGPVPFPGLVRPLLFDRRDPWWRIFHQRFRFSRTMRPRGLRVFGPTTTFSGLAESRLHHDMSSSSRLSSEALLSFPSPHTRIFQFELPLFLSTSKHVCCGRYVLRAPFSP